MKRCLLGSTAILALSSALFMHCKTPQTTSLVRDDEASTTSARCLPPLEWYEQNPLRRLSTSELEQHLRDRVEAKRWDCEINYSLAAATFGVHVPEGQNAKEVLESQGGFFGGQADIPTPNGNIRIPIYDNKMRYLWSQDGSKGEFLPPENWYNHIIPLRDGIDQPEMRRYIRNGDIIVYFSSGSRSTYLDAYNQFRSGHSATIMENNQDGQDFLMILDTPGAYARPITGADPSTFHVFRMMPRDDQGNAYPEAIADDYRDQVARWGTLALNRFDFEGNYDRLTFKSDKHIDFFAKRYLATQFEEFDNADLTITPMYCAWFSFQNLNLGFMRPMNQSGLSSLTYDPPGGQSMPFYDRLMQAEAGYQFPRIQESAIMGDSTFKQHYKAPDNIQPHNEMLFHPVTAPELVMNFLDRTIGPDVWVSEERWPQHAGLKMGIMQGGMSDFLAQFQTAPDPRGSPDEVPPSSEDYERYNSQLERMFNSVVALYQESLALQGDALAQKREEIRAKTYGIVENERTKPSIPKKWVPPYIYTREAEAFESFYRPPVDDVPYRPRVVYVGSVVPQRFLKDWGAEEQAILTALREVETTNRDWELQQETLRVLAATGAEFPSNKSGVDALLMELYSQCRGRDQATCDGLNDHELTALLTMRNHWRQDLIWSEPGAAAVDQVMLHNNYGLDDYLMMRTLVSYWNDPTDFRAAIYEGAASNIASAALNLRIIMSLAPSEMKSADQRRKPSEVTQGHPRRTSPLKCKPDNDVEITPDNRKCGDIERAQDGGWDPWY